MTADTDRRRFLQRAAGTTLGIGALATAAGLGMEEAAQAKPHGHGHTPESPVIGTWRGIVTLPHEEEVALFTFLPNGFFLSFAEGVHIATGRWQPTGRHTVTFTLWQVLPSDLKGLPKQYNGEVRALHHARVNGNRLTSQGTFRSLDIDGNEKDRGPVTAWAEKFDISTFWPPAG